MASSAKDVSTSLSKLSISTSSNTSNKPAKKNQSPIADSWEDESLSSDSSGSDTEIEDITQPRFLSKRSQTTSNEDDEDFESPSAPPPTPASATGRYSAGAQYVNPYTSLQPSRERQRTPDKRPEKTTSVAARLIAGGLGIRAPKRTEEQREFDKAVREKERRRREEEKSKVLDEERVKASVWEE